MYICEGKVSRFSLEGHIIGKYSSPEMSFGSSGGPWLKLNNVGK
jgi:hypothetical protein